MQPVTAIEHAKTLRIRNTAAWIVGHPNDAFHKKLKNDCTQGLYGEIFHVDAVDEGWAKGHLHTDGYEGWISMSDVMPVPDDMEGTPPAHNAYCSQILSHLYAEPDVKGRPATQISFMSPLNLNTEETHGNFIATDSGHWVNALHITSIAALMKKNNDLITHAKRFIGTPYVFGGRSGLGIDCTSLVQLCAARCGHKIPRDSTPQRESLADPSLTKADLQANDIVFFPGHVGIMATKDTIIHSFGHSMRVQIDKIDTIDTFYQEREGQGINGIARL